MEIEEAFFASVAAAFPSLPVSYPGVNFTPPDHGQWLEVTIFRSEPANQPLGNTRGVDQGIMQITVCERPGRGMIPVRNAANAVIGAYPKGYTFASFHRIVNNPYMLSVIVEPTKIMLPVSMSYSQ